MTEEAKLRMLLEYGKLRANKLVREHFERHAAAFAEFPNPSNWRALKRAMVYRQADMQSGDASLSPLLATFDDEG